MDIPRQHDVVEREVHSPDHVADQQRQMGFPVVHVRVIFRQRGKNSAATPRHSVPAATPRDSPQRPQGTQNTTHLPRHSGPAATLAGSATASQTFRRALPARHREGVHPAAHKKEPSNHSTRPSPSQSALAGKTRGRTARPPFTIRSYRAQKTRGRPMPTPRLSFRSGIISPPLSWQPSCWRPPKPPWRSSERPDRRCRPAWSSRPRR